MNNSLQYLTRPEGRIAYDVRGSGPLVVCVSGMSDLRSTYRHLVDPLVDAETVERHPALSDGQRAHDLDLAVLSKYTHPFDIIQECPVTGFRIEGGRVTGVETAFALLGLVAVAFLGIGLGRRWRAPFVGGSPIVNHWRTRGSYAEQAVVPAGETRDPARNLPRAIFFTIGVTTLLYFLVQLAFVSALPGGGSARFQPIAVDDVAQVVATALAERVAADPGLTRVGQLAELAGCTPRPRAEGRIPNPMCPPSASSQSLSSCRRWMEPSTVPGSASSSGTSSSTSSATSSSITARSLVMKKIVGGCPPGRIPFVVVVECTGRRE